MADQDCHIISHCVAFCNKLILFCICLCAGIFSYVKGMLILAKHYYNQDGISHLFILIYSRNTISQLHSLTKVNDRFLL